MRNKAIIFAMAAATLAGAAAYLNPFEAKAAKPVEPATKVQPTITLAGQTWRGSLQEALAIAKWENKPVLHLQMFGKLDDDYC